MQIKLSVFCEKVMEAGRFVALIVVGVWMIRLVELSHLRPESERIERQRRSLWKRLFFF